MAEDLGPEQLCFAVSSKTGTLLTRDGGRPLWATRAEWGQFPQIVTQLIPIKGEPPIGSLPFLDYGTPDVVGRMVKLISLLEVGADTLAERVAAIDQQLAGRVHERELLRRAAALIDPDNMAGHEQAIGGYEERLDWLAKYREVIS
jgi:hypothetical protein